MMRSDLIYSKNLRTPKFGAWNPDSWMPERLFRGLLVEAVREKFPLKFGLQFLGQSSVRTTSSSKSFLLWQTFNSSSSKSKALLCLYKFCSLLGFSCSYSLFGLFCWKPAVRGYRSQFRKCPDKHPDACSSAVSP